MKVEEQALVRRGDQVQIQKVVTKFDNPPPPNLPEIFSHLLNSHISKITKNRQWTSPGKQNYPSDPPEKISGPMHQGCPIYKCL